MDDDFHGKRTASTTARAFYRRVFTGALNDEDGGGGLGGPVIAAIFGNTPDKYAASVCGIRGAFELLPTNAYGRNWRGSQTRKGSLTYWNGDAFDLDMSTSSPPGLPGSKLAPPT